MRTDFVALPIAVKKNEANLNFSTAFCCDSDAITTRGSLSGILTLEYFYLEAKNFFACQPSNLLLNCERMRNSQFFLLCAMAEVNGSGKHHSKTVSRLKHLFSRSRFPRFLTFLLPLGIFFCRKAKSFLWKLT